jgi:hypothetical protein
MIDEVLKDLIYDLEGLLKKDKRFKANGDNQYRKQIKKIYQDSLYGRKPIDFTNLINLNNQVDIGDMAYLTYINNMLIKANDTVKKIINS